jgi:hypothetical protein
MEKNGRILFDRPKPTVEEEEEEEGEEGEEEEEEEEDTFYLFALAQQGTKFLTVFWLLVSSEFPLRNGAAEGEPLILLLSVS